MNGCTEWMDAIADAAWGDASGPALVKHLAVCPGCAAALRDARAKASRIDQALKRQVAVDPPSFGPDRVMARAGELNRARAPRRWWTWAAFAGAAAMFVLVVLWTARPKPKADVAALAAWRSPTQALLRPPVGMVWNTTPRLGKPYLKIQP
jgi:hypothetical protein